MTLSAVPLATRTTLQIMAPPENKPEKERHSGLPADDLYYATFFLHLQEQSAAPAHKIRRGDENAAGIYLGRG